MADFSTILNNTNDKLDLYCNDVYCNSVIERNGGSYANLILQTDVNVNNNDFYIIPFSISGPFRNIELVNNAEIKFLEAGTYCININSRGENITVNNATDQPLIAQYFNLYDKNDVLLYTSTNNSISLKFPYAQISVLPDGVVIPNTLIFYAPVDSYIVCILKKLTGGSQPFNVTFARVNCSVFKI